jgi:hypothetical protein
VLKAEALRTVLLASGITATVKSIDLAAFMDQAAIDYVLAVRVSRVSSIIMTHAVGGYTRKPAVENATISGGDDLVEESRQEIGS